MLPDKVREFTSNHHQGVLSCFRRNGATQMSVVTCGPYQDGVAFTTTFDRAKLGNLRRDPRCSLMVSKVDWWGYVVLECKARILSPGITDPDELRLALRDVFLVASGTQHSNWEEYDSAMVEDSRSAVIVGPEHIYGTAL